LRGRLYCEWPLSFGGISMRAAQETLKEVERVTRRGIVINTFMLDDSPSLRAFVEGMTRINKGRALYTRPDRLGEYLLVDYLAKKRKRGGQLGARGPSGSGTNGGGRTPRTRPAPEPRRRPPDGR